jgi:hypothetical protein
VGHVHRQLSPSRAGATALLLAVGMVALGESTIGYWGNGPGGSGNAGGSETGVGGSDMAGDQGPGTAGCACGPEGGS